MCGAGGPNVGFDSTQQLSLRSIVAAVRKQMRENQHLADFFGAFWAPTVVWGEASFSDYSAGMGQPPADPMPAYARRHFARDLRRLQSVFQCFSLRPCRYRKSASARSGRTFLSFRSLEWKFSTWAIT